MILNLTASDGFEIDSTKRTITPQGFLEAPASIARTGVQLYRARELGLDKHGIEPDRIVRLHRPSEELFNPDTMASFDGAPIINSPSHETVTADNWRKLSVGDVQGPTPGSNTLDVQKFRVRDKSAVTDVMSGKKFLSIGYKFDLDMTPGVNAQGESYDGVQRQIKGNHVLITDSPRGGPACAIADSAEQLKQGDRKMRNITINNVPVEVGDKEAGIIDNLIIERDNALKAQPSITYTVGDRSKTITGSDAIIKELTERDAKIADLTSKVQTPEQIAVLANERARVIGDAQKLDPEFKADDKATNKQIMVDVLTKVTAGDADAKELVVALLGGKAIGDSSDELLNAAFRTLSKTHKVGDAGDADAAMSDALLSKKVVTGDSKTSNDAPKLVGRDAFLANQNKAWKK